MKINRGCCHYKKRNQLLLICTLTLGVVLVVWRIAEVNRNRIRYPVEHYSLGQEVALDGAFLDVSNENTKGYYITVSDVEVMSSDDYLARYAPDADSSEIAIGSGDVAVLTLSARNEGNDSGFISTVSLYLIGGNRNTFYKVDDELWLASEPSLHNNSNALKLEPNTSYTTHLPFSSIANPVLFQPMDNIENYKREHISERSFELVLTNAPIRKEIDLNAEK